MTKDVNLIEQLKHYFGFDKFKGDQEAIIRNLLAGMIRLSLCPPVVEKAFVISCLP